MIDGDGELSVKRQAELLDVSRASVYYRPRPVSAHDLKLMRRIDELHLEAPFYGARKIVAQLNREGQEVGRRHVRTLMRRMGIEALYRKPRTSIPARGATIYPYLLEDLAIERPNQVWSSDLTYLPMAHGFLYLMAILDVAAYSDDGDRRFRFIVTGLERGEVLGDNDNSVGHDGIGVGTIFRRFAGAA